MDKTSSQIFGFDLLGNLPIGTALLGFDPLKWTTFLLMSFFTPPILLAHAWGIDMVLFLPYSIIFQFWKYSQKGPHFSYIIP